MKNKTEFFMGFAIVALFLSLAPAALAGNRWYVDGVNGNDSNDCRSSATACKTIGHAISLASSGDGIKVGPATYTENLVIATSLMIIGSGAATTTVDGNHAGAVFTISNAKARVFLSRLTIRNGSAQSGGGINNSGILTINSGTISGNGALWGGGVYNSGTLTINGSNVSGNSVAAGFNTPDQCGGGGIMNYGTLTINNTTVSYNSASTDSQYYPVTWGGGIYNSSGTVTINNGTISDNSVSVGVIWIRRNGAWGGGIYSSNGTVTINNGTVSDNTLGVYGGGDVGGFGIWSSGSAILQNSIIANPGENCNGTMISDGYNLSSDGACNFNGPGDMNNTDPLLAPLGNYGGPTQTMPLHSSSPAIDAGNPNGCADSNGNLLTTDQRGRPRPDQASGVCDIGAVERQKDLC